MREGCLENIMIRRLQEADIDSVLALWLHTNLQAHGFIPAAYWENNLAAVRDMLPQAEVYVYEDAGEIQAFVGLSGEYIEGIFVADKMQSQGIGKRLLDFVKTKKTELHLHVYQKNTGAARFYQREGFEIRHAGVDAPTGEQDYAMVWKQGQP